jgi:hypothetical protein
MTHRASGWMRGIRTALLSFIALGISATAQTQTFTRGGLYYALDFPSPSWRAMSRVDMHEHFEFINGDD